MPFDASQVSADDDFDELVRVEWASYEQPYCRLIRLFFPIFGDGPEARAAALKESTERQLRWHRGDPTSHWIKAVDSETGKIAGAACWHIYETNPYGVQSEEECTWYPKGESRKMANSLMGQFLTPRMKYMTKPHICMIATCRDVYFTLFTLADKLRYLVLDICFVHPHYRRLGVGRLLMAWGIKKADELGFESYIDATEAGIPLYEMCGYAKASRVDFDASKDEASQQWRELREELLPFSFWPMWRPVGGIFKDTMRPWEQVA